MSEATEERLRRIGEVAEQVGITPRTIRYYEELGLLGTDAARVKGGHRLYGEDDVTRLHELVRLRELLGLSLEQLQRLAEDKRAQECLRSRWASTTDDAERIGIIRSAIPHVERQLDLVHAREQELADFRGELTAKLARMQALLAELEG
jgi:DNA-binding transcriptional MerR regulator